MKAGSLDRRIRIEHATETISARGEPTKTWLLLTEVWAEVRPLRGSELYQALQLAAKAEVSFRVRYPATLTPFLNADETFRIVYAGQTYDVTHVGEIGRREGLEILAHVRSDA